MIEHVQHHPKPFPCSRAWFRLLTLGARMAVHPGNIRFLGECQCGKHWVVEYDGRKLAIREYLYHLLRWAAAIA